MNPRVTKTTARRCVTLFSLLMAPLPLARAQEERGEAACAALRQLQVEGADLSEVTAEWLPAGSPLPQEPPWVAPLKVRLPDCCRLGATLDRRTGADGKSYGIGFALALPKEWNGRFLFQGGGPPVCFDAGDVTDSGRIGITSVVALLNFLFSAGPAPAVPYPNPGLDPTPDDLGECLTSGG